MSEDFELPSVASGDAPQERSIAVEATPEEIATVASMIVDAILPIFTAALSAERARAEEAEETVKGIWQALGIATYEQAKPFTIAEHIARLKSERDALREAVEKEREECAKVAEGRYRDFDFQAALAGSHDTDYGYASGRLAAAAAIRTRTGGENGR